MKLGLIVACAAVLVLSPAGLSAHSSEAVQASVEGSVVKDPGGEPLKKAVVELIGDAQDEPANYTATSEPDGHFRISAVRPGRYVIFVEHPGYISVDAHHHHAEGITISVDPGQQLKDLQLHMLAASVLTGRVVDEDGDPMPNVNVAVLGRSVSSRNGQLDVVGTDRTNDIGEYRISGLPPSRYFISATPTLDFQAIATPPKEAAAAGKLQLAYVATYYPNTTDRSQAATVELRPGEETPIDFSLVRTPTARLSGTVANLAPGAHAVVTLHSAESSLVFNETDAGKDGSFELRNVAPGNYTLMAIEDSGDKSRIARQSINVNGGNLDSLRLNPVPGATIHGQVRTPGRAFDFSQLTLYLEPTDGNPEALNAAARIGEDPFHVKADGAFEWKNIPAGSYYVEAASNKHDNWIVDSVLLDGRDISDSELNVGGGVLSLTVTLSPDGATVEGAVVDEKNQPASGAVVVAVPAARFRKRQSRYQRVVTDQRGHFQMRGVIPGDYSLFAWETLDGNAYLDPDFLKLYDARGTSLHLEKS
ncbi:MAG TPA: carboxypeptidase-like regulatory domain-containing protein, partial [Terriglobia bacterium]|nr:carboxypeptidase-like regulatory domain-containing protein [Terriglobia bacterium]